MFFLSNFYPHSNWPIKKELECGLESTFLIIQFHSLRHIGTSEWEWKHSTSKFVNSSSNRRSPPLSHALLQYTTVMLIMLCVLPNRGRTHGACLNSVMAFRCFPLGYICNNASPHWTRISYFSVSHFIQFEITLGNREKEKQIEFNTNPVTL